MKKLLCAILTCALCACLLAGCGGNPPPEESGRTGGDAPTATEVPAEGEHGEVDQASLLDAMPTLKPVERIAEAGADATDGGMLSEFQTYDESALPAAQYSTRVIDPSTYQYSALTDTTLGFTFNYPAHWENVPGVFTVCFREKPEEGKFPARVAISAKKLVHSPEGTVLEDELTSYMRMIYRQYDPKTFQVGTPNTDNTFLGKPAASNTYLAYWGDTEIKGFIIGQPVGRILYVFHFCASYEDYIALEGVMRYMLRSVELAEDK